MARLAPSLIGGCRGDMGRSVIAVQALIPDAWYSWNTSGDDAAMGLRTVVTWTLKWTKGGTVVRMEQSGFRPEEEPNYQGANYGWQRFIGRLERVAAGLG